MMYPFVLSLSKGLNAVDDFFAEQPLRPEQQEHQREHVGQPDHFEKEHFKLQVGDLTIAVNPVSKEGKGKVAKYGSDITLITTNHPDYNGAEQTEHGDKIPFVIHGAGEYEVKDIFIKGFNTVTKLMDGKKEKEYQNTSYVFMIDGIRITFLGALSSVLTPEQKEIIDETDVLFLP